MTEENMSRTEVKLKWKKLHPDFKLPKQATVGSAGLDMIACINEPVTIMPGKRALISLGCAVEIPEGYCIDVRPRSGLALKEGITILNTPGLIDTDYRGPLGAIVVNLGEEWYTVRPLDKICQVTVAQVPVVESELVEELSSTDRGAGGFGSSGKQ